MANYESWKNSVLGTVVGDGQCVALVVNNSRAWTEALYPGVSWTSIFKPVPDAKDLLGDANSSYFEAVANDHNNPNQVPVQGDTMVFGATPASGYTNQFNNPAGHTGVCDSATSNGYVLLQQNSPTAGAAVNLKEFPWKFRPCLGWLHPVNVPSPSPSPAPSGNVGKTLFLPPTTGPWHLYNDNGPYLPSAAKGLLVPSEFGGLRYTIVADKGDGVYVINTQMFGQGALWTRDSSVVIS